MKRLQYSVEELKKLLGYLDSARKYTPVVATAPMQYSERLLYAHIGLLPETTPLTPYTQKQVYEAIKRDSIARVVEIMYHTPLEKLPLLINRAPKLIGSIIKWRLSISK